MTKKRIFILLALVIVVGLGLGYWQIYLPRQAAAKAAKTSTYKTTTVRKGSVSVSVTGSGKVITSTTMDLGFSTSGTIASMNAAVGSQVKKNDVLATLEGYDSLELAVKNQELAVETAQTTLDQLKSDAELTLAQAEEALASAQTTYDAAKTGVHNKGDGRCSVNTTQTYFFKYEEAQKNVSTWEGYLDSPKNGYGHDYIMEHLNPLRKIRDQALANLNYCATYTDQEIADSQAAFQLASAKLDLAKNTYETLKASNGVDAQAVELAEAQLENAKLQLESAQQKLSVTTLVAPFDGTVTVVNGGVGSQAGTGTVITVADMSNPEVQVNIDETDLGNFAVGCRAEVTFEALSGQTFTGKVTQVSPTMVTVQSVSMVQGLIDLEQKQAKSGKNLPLGLTAVTDVICHESNDTLTVPLQAVHDASSQSPYVYVLNAQGQPEKRTVALGIQTIATAEVLSGLNEGETVITSTVKTS